MELTSKKYIFSKYIKNSECTHIFQVCKKISNTTFTHGGIRDEMATCIVIYLKTVFVNIYTFLKQCKSCFLMYKRLLS